MNKEDKKKLMLGGMLLIGLTIVLGLNSTFQGNPDTQTFTPTDWQQIELTDVRNDESFNIAELEKPVLVETFAVWCPTCTRQQQEIKKLHDSNVNVTSVSLDVDPNEDASKVRDHIRREGFDWHYAVAPAEMTQDLIREYDTSIANPPSAPAILVCENNTRKLENGVKPASKLEQEINEGC